MPGFARPVYRFNWRREFTPAIRWLIVANCAVFTLQRIASLATDGETDRWIAEWFGLIPVLVVPGLTKTNLRDNMARSEGKANIDFAAGMPPEGVAAKIVKAIIKGKREVVIGRDARWMLRMHRWFPRLLDRLICRRVKKLYARQSAQESIANVG